MEKKTFPGNCIPVYLGNYIDFLTVFIGEDPAVYKEYMANHSSCLARLEKTDHNTPWFLLCRGNMNLQVAVLKLKFGEYASAAAEINHAYKDLKENKKRFPDFLPNNTGLGTIHVLIGIIPESYTWLLNLFGMEGDIRTGLNEISTVSGYSGNDAVYELFRAEALFNVALLDANLARDSKNALQIIREYDKRKPGFPDSTNSLMIFIRSGIYMKCGLNDQAITLLDLYHPSPGEYPFYYLYYMHGLGKLNRLDPDADRFLILFLKNYSGRNYVKSAYQKLAWTFLLKGNLQKYTEYTSKITTHGGSIIDADRQADKEAKNNLVPNFVLLKARLLFDGGYYDRALDLLLNKKITEIIASKKDLLEYTYRSGRIYQAMGDLSHALSCYEKTIRDGSSLPFYFAANAALQSGVIYEVKGDLVNAEKEYRLSLSMKNDEYKTSLSQKARAGLKRVSGKH